MPENRFGKLSVTGRALALLQRVVVNGKSGRINSQFDKLAGPYPSLNHGWGNPKVIGVLQVHCQSVHQLVAIGELLSVKLLGEVTHSISVKNG